MSAGGNRGKRLIVAVLALSAVALAVLGWMLYTFDPMTTDVYPKCVSHLVTGYDCPGCGTARALHALAHGHVLTALRFNGMLLVAIPFVIYLILCEFLPRDSRWRRLYSWRWLPLAVLIITILWTVARNIWLPL